MNQQQSSVKILSAATATGYSDVYQPRSGYMVFQAMGTTSAGAGAATILVQGSLVPSPNTSTDVDWVTLGTITLVLGTTQVTDAFAVDAPWRHVRMKVSAISGTNASVNGYLGA